jgi:ribosomal protein S18 acetylase RimI-like enzyme
MADSAWILRNAEAEDDPAVGELLVQAFVQGYAEKMPEVVVHDERKRDLRDVARKREAGSVIVAELNGRIVGALTLLPPGSPLSEAWLPGAANIRFLGIDPSVRGSGIADKLMDEAERRALVELGCNAVCLHVRRGAHGVARFYEKRGYRRAPEGDQDLLPVIYLQASILSLAP